jgi:hypothetical protein
LNRGWRLPSLSQAIVEREGDIARLDAELSQLAEPLHQRLAVIPSWVENQLRDLAGLLGETPERAKAEFRRLGLTVVMNPIRDEGSQSFYRATGQAALPCLAEIRDLSGSTVDRSLPRSARASAIRSLPDSQR